MALRDDYMEKLKRRGRESRVYKKHQLLGLEIAQLLGDEKHKALYIKLAKEDGERLLELAKDVSKRRGILKKGAYFMSCIPQSAKRQRFHKTKHGR
ncbi:hypothetical protein C4571_00120 [Candidatus Parcubacteria bacterium]|nr:MAG: hypothetical protein C4571_00120 [Candidatus Parcubacteria bacterium]